MTDWDIEDEEEVCDDCGKVKCECDREPADVYYDDDGDCYDI
jgi:hypothetical protein